MKKTILSVYFFTFLFLSTQAIGDVKITTDITTIPSGFTYMLIPKGHGMITGIWPYAARYPCGNHNMQLMAFYNPSTQQIYYVQTKDSEGRVIDWELFLDEDNSWQLELTFFTLDGQNPEIDKDTSMTAEDLDDFYKVVASRYKEWALEQSWANNTSSIMDEAKTISVTYSLNPGDGSQLNTEVLPYIDLWGGDLTLCWVTGWRRWDFSSHWPDYAFPDDGYSRAEGIALLKEHNSLALPYINGCLWDSDNTEDTFSNPSNSLAVYDVNDMALDESGDVYPYKETNIHFACQTRERWRQVMKNAWDDLKKAGAAGVYYDMAAITEPRLCYSTDHDHEPGDPLEYQRGMREIMYYIRENGGTIFTEGFVETLIDRVDAFLAYPYTTWNEEDNGVIVVPLTKEVYGDITRLIGWSILSADQDINDLTPEIFKKEIVRSGEFKTLYHGSPYFIGWAATFGVQNLLLNDDSYSPVLDYILTEDENSGDSDSGIIGDGCFIINSSRK
ncbi:MAG: hypothetical protein GY874_10205 [Desulfobacteraceae bacterium]|nr:hypothetical protein [Desulfobacteraceae bacterium]